MKRRDVFRTGGYAALLGLTEAQAGAAAPAKAGESQDIYTRVGGQPFINLTATYTINGGALSRPEVKRAMEEASYWPVNLDELMAKVGAYLAPKLGAESAMVTCGASSALTHATSGVLAGTDPEKIQQLPNLTGLKNEVIIARQSRNAYDQALRTTGVKTVEVETAEQAERAVNEKTAMLFMLGTGEVNGPVKLEHLVAIKQKHGLPILVDAAAELPLKVNPYLSRGADMVAYSGGKILRGPQSSGLLLGRTDLIKAAWANSSPHHAFGRAMKASKEETMGLVAAIDAWVANGYTFDADYKRWEGWLKEIAARVAKFNGVTTELRPPKGASPFPTLQLDWTQSNLYITAGEIGEQLLHGSPRIKSHGEGDGRAFHIRPVSMKEGDAKIVADRLEAILRAASTQPKPGPAPRPPVADLSGEWRVALQFSVGSTEHNLTLQASGATLAGTHRGRLAQSAVKGKINGDHVSFRSSLRYEGQALPYDFKGTVAAGGKRMSGEVDLGEYGQAAWSAERA
ncbi:MAG: aminotransferase class V-fold PLP-dependent enzyme [Bryobacterales bacterium]|nr:aminotransferase class V-fold PLP-dependent enzyme [Bryobacterales bacterium]